MVARQQAANGTCKVVFHQSREPNPYRTTNGHTLLTDWGTSDRLVVAKDTRHHCCAKFLQECTGSDQWCPLLQPVCHRCPTLSTECVHLLSCKGLAHMTDGTQPCRCPLLQPVCQQCIPANWEVSVIACGVLMIGFVGLIVA